MRTRRMIERARPDGLFRDPEHGILAGVCAGVAAWLDVRPAPVRVGFALALIGFFPVTVLAYLALAWVLPVAPPPELANPWRRPARPAWDDDDADQAFARVAERYQGLERRLRRLEGAVVSGDAELKRRFRDLADSER